MPRKLVWTEGLFITEHHFQQLDRYHETLLHERLAAARPFPWGVASVAIDERALGDAQIRILQMRAVLPDGTVIDAGEGREDVIPARSFQAAFGPQMSEFDIYVGLPRDSTAATVMSGESPDLETRYARYEATVSSANAEGGEQRLVFARRNLQILFASELREGFEAVRVAQLARSTTGAAVLRESFLPPIFAIRASPWLMIGLRSVLTAMIARQRSLAASRRQRTATSVELDARDIHKLLLLDILNAYIPGLSHAVDQGTAHPEDVYLLLAGLIGRLSTLTVVTDPSLLPKWNYLNLGPTFQQLMAQALSLIEASLSERYVEIPLQLGEGGSLLGRVEDPQHLRGEFYLGVTGTIPEEQIRERLPRLMKIASWRQLAAIINSAMNGAKVAVEYHPPGALPLKPGVTFFHIEKTPDFWRDIVDTSTIGVCHPLDPGAIKIALYAIPEGMG